MEKQKKCPKCQQNKSVDQFGKNRVSTDGFTCYCKKCNKEKIAEKRRSFDDIKKNIPVDLHKQLKILHNNWEKNGFPPHLKPVLTMGKLLPKIDSKPKRRGRSVEIFHMREDGELQRIGVNDSIKGAIDIYGTTYQKIKYSSESGMAVDGKFFKINF